MDLPTYLAEVQIRTATSGLPNISDVLQWCRDQLDGALSLDSGGSGGESNVAFWDEANTQPHAGSSVGAAELQGLVPAEVAA